MPLSVTVPLPGSSKDENTATVAAVEEFTVPEGSEANLTATGSNVVVHYQPDNEMDTYMAELVNMIESDEIPDVTENIHLSTSLFSPDNAELAQSVSLNYLCKEMKYHRKC